MHTNTVDLKFRQKGIFVSPKSKQNPPKPPLRSINKQNKLIGYKQSHKAKEETKYLQMIGTKKNEKLSIEK